MRQKKTKTFWWPLSPVKYVLPYKTFYPFVDDSLTFSDISLNFVDGSLTFCDISLNFLLHSMCFVLFEVTFSLIILSFPSKSVVFMKLAISDSLSNFFLLFFLQVYCWQIYYNQMWWSTYLQFLLFLSSQSTFLTRVLTFGILFSTVLRAAVVANLVMLGILSSISLILALYLRS